MKPGILAAAVILGGAFCASAHAQTPKRVTAIMRGQVQDARQRPLSDAVIEILGADLTQTTPASGAYRFEQIPPGNYWVAVRRIGYAPLRVALTFKKGQDREIEFELEDQPVKLPDVVVNAENELWNRKYADFRLRSRGSRGKFLTRDDLERWPYSRLGEVVARYNPLGFSGFSRAGYVGSSWGSSTIGWAFGGGDTFGCAPAVSINGGGPMAGWRLEDFWAEDVEAVEIYRTRNMLPIQFQDSRTDCGLVVVWMTR